MAKTVTASMVTTAGVTVSIGDDLKEPASGRPDLNNLRALLLDDIDRAMANEDDAETIRRLWLALGAFREVRGITGGITEKRRGMLAKVEATVEAWGDESKRNALFVGLVLDLAALHLGFLKGDAAEYWKILNKCHAGAGKRGGPGNLGAAGACAAIGAAADLPEYDTAKSFY